MSVDVRTPPDNPAVIDAVPLRHPWRWVAAIVIVVLVALFLYGAATNEAYGWPVAKGSPLAASLQKALEHLIESGDYKTIAANWGVEAGMIDKPVINGATS